ncbi:four F5 [Lecanosticta acicola]|uniref:Four F5 n=1 Tax=Lecanosticta acicola TaxID=111012 RepID=A0AAI9E5L7_9PEZI|nr:four F5 [Lecanosticta acicola]
MARGNQRDKAREKNLAKLSQEKHKTTASGTQQAREKENVAAIMRAKQAAADAKKTDGGKK